MLLSLNKKCLIRWIDIGTNILYMDTMLWAFCLFGQNDYLWDILWTRREFHVKCAAWIVRHYWKQAVWRQIVIYHFSNEGVCSWYDFSKVIAEYAGNSSCVIHPCHSDEFPNQVKRPSCFVLYKAKIQEAFGTSIPYWTTSLKVCISNFLSIWIEYEMVSF